MHMCVCNDNIKENEIMVSRQGEKGCMEGIVGRKGDDVIRVKIKI